MINSSKIFAVLLSLVFMQAACPELCSRASAQRKQCIDAGWHFTLGDGSAAVTNPSVADSWRTLNLPHDWSVEPEAARMAGGRVIGPFSSNSVGGFQTGNTVGGEGWYHKQFKVQSSKFKVERYVLYFEGAYNQSTLYVNGQRVNFCPYGYSSFRIDVTSLLHEGENDIVVRVQNEGKNTRWYSGSGIYRHVWLITTPKMYLDEWDSFVRMNNEELIMNNGLCSGKIAVETIVHNEGEASLSGSVSVDIADAQGTTVATASQPVTCAANNHQSLVINLQLSNAQAWSPESPYLYTAMVSVKDGDGTVIDSFEKRIGLRTLHYSATEGFLLNGEPTLLRGGCVHHDNGMLGAAAFDKAERRKLLLLKNQGFNAVRCSHNLPSESFLDICDELGLMAIDECFDQWYYEKNPEDYHRYFAEWSDRDITDMVRRDRNHASVIMWSIGNEIPGRIEPAGKAAAKRLRNDILKYDTTRPITAAICGWDAGDAWNSAGQNWDIQSDNAFESLDIAGYNYLYSCYEYDHPRYPERVMCGLESYPKLASENWTLVEKHPYVIGDFVWTAMDYLGEAGIGAAFTTGTPPWTQGWPWFNGYCGDIDLIGQKKPQSYYRDVVWREKAVTMAVMTTPSYNNAWGWQLEEQCWTYPGMEGQNVTINVYSRAPKVRLYLNDVSQGDHEPGATFWTGYNITYQPGTLRVVNLDAAGNEVAGEEFVLKTTGKATDVRLVYDDDNSSLTDDIHDLCYVTIELIDDEGNVVTADKETQIRVSNEGVGELIGCCTACPDDMKSFRSLTPKVFRGRALAIVRSTGEAGEVRVKAEMMEPEADPTFPMGFNISSGIREGSGVFSAWKVTSGNTEVTVQNFYTKDFATTAHDFNSNVTWWHSNKGKGCIVSDAVDHAGSYGYEVVVPAGKKLHLKQLLSDVLMDDNQLSLQVTIAAGDGSAKYTSPVQKSSAWRNTIDTDLDVQLPAGTYTITANLSDMSNGKYYLGALELRGQLEEDVETAITEVKSEGESSEKSANHDYYNNKWYDLAGRIVLRRSSGQAETSLFTHHSSIRPGLYIHNGKKMIVK